MSAGAFSVATMSIPTTDQPERENSRATYLPRNPATPVMRTVFIDPKPAASIPPCGLEGTLHLAKVRVGASTHRPVSSQSPPDAEAARNVHRRDPPGIAWDRW